MGSVQTERGLGIKLVLLALAALIIGYLTYTVLYGVSYLANNPTNMLGLLLTVSAFVGLLLMMKSGAALTVIAVSFNSAIQMFNLQYAYNAYPSFVFVDYVTAVFIPIISLAIGIAVLRYVFKQIFAGKFNPETAEKQQAMQRTKGTYLMMLVNVFFVAYLFAWIVIDQSISPFQFVILVFTFVGMAGLLLLNRWGIAVATFVSALFFFRVMLDLQWTILYGLTWFSTDLLFVLVTILEVTSMVLVLLQIYYLYKRLFKA